MFKNPKLALFYLSQGLASIYFWGVISIPYFLYRGLSPSQAFNLLAIYNLFGLIFEYPTGVIGDRFGYRKSLVAAAITSTCAMILLAQQGGFFFYLCALSLLALGTGLFSGNDMGVLKSISLNLKKDTAAYNSLMDFVLFLSAIAAGFISQWSYQATLYLGALTVLSSGIPLYFLHAQKHAQQMQASVMTIVSHSVKALRGDVLRLLFIVAVVFGGFLFVVKNIVGSFQQLYHIDIFTIGIIIGIGGLLRSIGGGWYTVRLGKRLSWATLAITICLIIAGLSRGFVVVIAMIGIIQFCFGYLFAKIDGDVNELASDEVRSSLFSLKRLVIRFVAATYLYFYGLAFGANEFGLFMVVSGISLLASTLAAWKYVNGKYGGKKIEVSVLAPVTAVIHG